QGERLLPKAPGRELISGAVGSLPGIGRLQRSDVVAERRVQFIVVGDAATPAARRPGPPSTELMTIRPGKSWWDRVSHIPRIPGLGKEPLEHGIVERWEHPKLGPLMLLRDGKTSGSPYSAPAAQYSLLGTPNSAGAKPVSLVAASRDQGSSGADETWVAY